MQWVTWENVGVDRMACAWLIRRFVDPQAEFRFIPAGSLSLLEAAEPFDLPGVRLSHRQGHCTFHTLLDEYNLADPALHRLARIIDEADTVQEAAVEPAAPGLDLICRALRTAKVVTGGVLMVVGLAGCAWDTAKAAQAGRLR